MFAQQRIELLLRLVLRRQYIHPLRHAKADLRDRKFVQDRAQNLQNILLRQLQTVDRQAGSIVLFLQLGSQCLCSLPRRIGRVEQDEKRLSDVLQLCDDTRFRRGIVLPRELSHAAIGRDDNTDRRMLADDFSRPLFRCCAHGDLMIVPRRRDQALFPVFVLTVRAGNHVSNAVDQAHGGAHGRVQLDRDGIFRDELRFCGHDRPAGAALRQLVACALPHIFIGDIRQHERFHESFDEGRFPGAHRADNADVNIPAGTGGNVCVN